MSGGHDRLLRGLATAGTVAMVLTLGGTTAAVFRPRLAAAVGITPAPPPPAYVTGSTVDVPAEWYADSPYTLVVFAREACAACQKAAPYLSGLVKQLHGSKVAITFAAAGPDVPENHSYAASLGIPAARFHLSPRVRARVTPTLLLVDQRGTIVEAWEGIGPEAKQRVITAALEQRR